MKIRYNTIIILITCLFTIGCTDNFDKINQNPYTVDDEVMSSGGVSESWANHISVMQGIVIPTQENLYQYMISLGCETLSGYMGQTKHTDLGRYIFNVGFISYPFTDAQSLPKLITEYNALSLETQGNKENPFFAIGTVLKVSIMQHLSDMYGPIPYDFGGTSAQKPYQSVEDIYRMMIQDLSWAINTLKSSNLNKAEQDALSNTDNVYNADLSLWAKYAASLKLRLAIRCSNVVPEEAKVWGQEAVNSGLISNNNEIASIKTSDNQFVKMCKTWGDTRVGADIVEYMVAYDDPRLPAYFTKTSRSSGGQYFGLRSGVVTPDKEELTKVGLYSLTNQKENSPMIWMTAAEVQFLLSEAALRGWNVGGDAKGFYTKGIEMSMQQNGVSVGNYLENTNTRGAFVDDVYSQFNDPTFESTIKVKWADDKNENLAQIITQKYIAMFPYGSSEAWAEYRRTGYPNLLPPIDYNHDVRATYRDSQGRDLAGYRRYPIPTIEYSVNTTNTENAVANFLNGQDSPNTNLWWALDN